MNWYAKTGRAALVRELMAKGLSVRKAEKAVNAVFALMSRALRRGEEVETPLGMFVIRGSNAKGRQTLQRSRSVNTGKMGFRLVTLHPRRSRVVKFIPNEALDLTPPPCPAPPPSPAEIECRRLAELLIGRLNRPITDQEMARLRQAARFPSEPKDLFVRLLARLRDIEARGSSVSDVDSLAGCVQQLYWV